MSLPTDKKSRKETPMYSGLLKYFPDALAAVARVSYHGNQQHNPGEPLHWAREKSTDHHDCCVRHLVDAGTIDDDGQPHSAKLAWRALAILQLEEEARMRALKNPGHIEHMPESNARLVYEQMRAAKAKIDRGEFPTTEPLTHSDRMDEPTQDIPSPIIQPVPGEDYNEMLEKLFVAGATPGIPYPIDLNEHEHKSAISNKWTQAQVDATPLGSFHDGVIQDTLRLAGMGDPPPAAKPICYISGPMTGYPDYNFPAFDAARDLLISKGFEVISPADVDRQLDNGGDLRSKDVYAERDVAILIDIKRKNRPGSCVVTLPGWNASKGAQAEVAVAEWIGLKIRDISEFQ